MTEKWKKGLLALCLLSLLPATASAQRLESKVTNVDAGKTGYEQPITATFRFRNKGSRRLFINAVYPDCNCTKVDYPKEVKGHTDFEIKMTYDARQLGHFNKQAAIVTNATEKPVYICMTGVVLEDYIDYSNQFPVVMGDLRLDKNELMFDDINLGDQQIQQLRIYNNGTTKYQPTLMHLPSYLKAKMTPEVLVPNQIGTFTVTLNSTMLHDFGLTQSTIYVAPNPGDKVSQEREISVSAVLLPSFVGVSNAQLQYAPKMELSKENVDIVFDKKKKKSDVITITNKGRTELEISSLQLFTIGLRVSLDKSRLNPGESTKLKITAIREELKQARTRPRILMITNDPRKPKITINIRAKE